MLVFDLETYADESCIPLLPEPEAPANYKAQDAIEKYKAEARVKQIARMALDPAACRIIALGTCLDGTVDVQVCPDLAVERATISRFWDQYDNAPVGDVCGYAIVAFDLPVLLTRSRILGIPTPKINLRKYGSPDVKDLMLEMSFGGIVDYKSLNFWVSRLKLDVPPDDTTGKDMAACVEAGDWHAIAHHCSVDVLKTYALAQYLQVL